MSEVRDQDYGTYHDEAVNVPVLERPAFWSKAACLGVGSDKFFIEGEGHTAAVKAAQAVCDRCPVKDECLEWALLNLSGIEDCGIWGGAGRQKRVRLRRERGIVNDKRRAA